MIVTYISYTYPSLLILVYWFYHIFFIHISSSNPHLDSIAQGQGTGPCFAWLLLLYLQSKKHFHPIIAQIVRVW